MNLTQPKIQEETSDFAIVFKPAKMHSTYLRHTEENITLTDWFLNTGSADKSLPDSGLMHRLDFETHGLVLFAKNKKCFDFFKELQNKGDFIKEYSAICQNNSSLEISADGFPVPPDINFLDTPKTIMSYFRPYGPGRKLVRPVIDDKSKKEIAKDNSAGKAGSFYRTDIIDTKKTETVQFFTVRLRRGFRHQIRCHLSWIGFPILGDTLYNLTQRHKETENSFLKLRAHALIFTDPSTGERRECRINPLGVCRALPNLKEINVKKLCF